MRIPQLLKRVRHFLEYIPIWALYHLCRVLPFSCVSNIGKHIGWFASLFYPLLSKVGLKNLDFIFPAASQKEKKKIIRKCCENFGRVFLEYFALDKATTDPNYTCDIVGLEKLEPFFKKNRRIIYISAHLGNWEVGAFEFHRLGKPVVPVYRHINNPYLNQLILKCRSHYVPKQIVKGPKSGFQCLKALKKGYDLVFLGDQKYNQGPLIPFFGMEAPTPDGMVKLAQMVEGIIVPIRILRVNNTSFKIILEDPLDTTQYPVDAISLLKKINTIIETWVRESPDQWFIFHRRWSKSFYKNKQ